jgi:hypothetical protein
MSGRGKPHDPDARVRLSREAEDGIRQVISSGRAAPSVRVMYGEILALRREVTLAAGDWSVGVPASPTGAVWCRLCAADGENERAVAHKPDCLVIKYRR